MTTRSSTAARRGFIYVPLDEVFYPIWKVLIIDTSGNTYTIADFNSGASTANYLVSASITRPHSSKQSTASIQFSNPLDEDTMLGLFTNKFVGGEVLEIYADYVDGSSLLYRGKVVDPMHTISSGGGFGISIESRDYPEMTDTVTTGLLVSTRADVAACSVLYEAGFNDIYIQFWNGSEWVNGTYTHSTRSISWDGDVSSFPGTGVTFSWQDKKPWTVLEEIFGRVDMDFYLEYDKPEEKWRLRTLIKNEKQNDTMSVTYGNNILSLPQFGPENSSIYNSVTVYGKQESSNIIMLATAQDTSSQASLWKKKLVVNDAALETNSEIKEKAAFLLQKNLVSEKSGRVTIVGDPSVRPGEQVLIVIPHIAVSGYHTVSEITQNIGPNGFTTTMDITKFSKKIANQFKEKIDIEAESEPALNLNDMTDSYNIYFDESPSVMTLDGCIEVGGKLQLDDGEVLGVATSSFYDIDYTAVSCELRKYSNFPIDENDTYEVTADGGATWDTLDITSGLVHNFSSTGSRIGLRMTLRRSSVDDTSPSYESVVLLFK